ncbi:MAG: GxxExxY protein [Burkholderiaceae bacterium]
MHRAQILTYMKLAKISTGLILNFNPYFSPKTPVF